MEPEGPLMEQSCFQEVPSLHEPSCAEDELEKARENEAVLDYNVKPMPRYFHAVGRMEVFCVQI